METVNWKEAYRARVIASRPPVPPPLPPPPRRPLVLPKDFKLNCFTSVILLTLMFVAALTTWPRNRELGTVQNITTISGDSPECHGLINCVAVEITYRLTSNETCVKRFGVRGGPVNTAPPDYFSTSLAGIPCLNFLFSVYGLVVGLSAGVTGTVGGIVSLVRCRRLNRNN